jgi:hypothetical protein
MAERQNKRSGLVTTVLVAFVLLLWGGVTTLIALSIRDGSFSSLWANINEGQAQIIASTVAALGLLTSALLVPFVFKDRIRDLDTAVAEMSGTMKAFENDASERLEKLSKLLNERMAEIERRSTEDVDRIGDVLEEIRSAVILSVSEGHITDPKHAKVFVQHLYNDAVAALQRRVREKPYLREVTRAQINELRTMSSRYLNKLIEAQVISSQERGIIDRVKEFAYRRNDFVVADVGEINKARSDFDRAFGESAVQNVDIEQPGKI